MRIQNRIAKMAAQLGNTTAMMYVTAAPSDTNADDVLQELGIVFGDRDQHVHLRKFFDVRPARLVAVHPRCTP